MQGQTRRFRGQDSGFVLVLVLMLVLGTYPAFEDEDEHGP